MLTLVNIQPRTRPPRLTASHGGQVHTNTHKWKWDSIGLRLTIILNLLKEELAYKEFLNNSSW